MSAQLVTALDADGNTVTVSETWLERWPNDFTRVREEPPAVAGERRRPRVKKSATADAPVGGTNTKEKP